MNNIISQTLYKYKLSQFSFEMENIVTNPRFHEHARYHENMRKGADLENISTQQYCWITTVLYCKLGQCYFLIKVQMIEECSIMLMIYSSGIFCCSNNFTLISSTSSIFYPKEINSSLNIIHIQYDIFCCHVMLAR